jgi:hypothetical protein
MKTQPYAPPPGYYDLPFTWAFDASIFANGSTQKGNSIYLLGGYGDFLLRRIVGLDRILAKDGTGMYRISRASRNVYMSSDPVQAPNCPELAIVPGELYPETGTLYFDLYGILKPTAALTSQLAFQGIRRQKGTKDTVTYKNFQKTFTYKVGAILSAVAGSPIHTATQIVDYDFELYQIILMVQTPSGPQAITVPVCSLKVFDQNKVALSNIPILDIFYNGAPGSPYENGAIVTPILYRKDSALDIDFYGLATSVVSPSGALISVPPAQVDPSTLKSDFIGVPDDEYNGPWFFGGKWWGVFAQTSTPFVNNQLNVFSSVDRITWAIQDGTHAPPNVSANPTLVYNTYFDPVGGVIYVAYQLGGESTLRFSTFNLTTGLWTNTAYQTIPSIADCANFDLVARADGSIVLVYQTGALGAAYNVNTGGVWAGPIALTPSNAASTTPNALLLDPVTQTTHAIYWVPGVAQPASNQIWNWVTISNAAGGNVLGVPAQITTGINKQGGDVMYRGVIWNGSLVLPLLRSTITPTATRITVFIGTPLAAPVWSVVDIQVRTNASGAGFLYANLFVDSTGKLWVVMGLNGTTAQAPLQILYSTNTGAGFSVPALFYDMFADPPAVGISPLESINEVAVGVSPAGVITGLVNFQEAGLYALLGGNVVPSVIAYLVGRQIIPC